MSRARRAANPVLGEQVSSARMRHHGVGPRKVRDIADLIRGLTVSRAFEQLTALHRPSGAPMVTNLLKSAVSNATQKGHSGDQDELIVGRIFVDGGPMMKRFQPMGHGRAGEIRKRTCHVTLELFTPAE